VARLVGDGKRVLILSREAAALARMIETRNCRTIAVAVEGRRPSLDLDPGHWASSSPRETFEGEERSGDGRFDAIVVSDLLGRIDDPRAVLRALKGQIRPEGSLIVALHGIAPVGGRLALVDGGPLGAGSGVLFSEEGLLGLLEDAGYVIGHVERVGPETGADPPGPPSDPGIHDCLIVAHPLPVPGLDFLQGRMRDLARQARDAAREAEELRRQAAVADQRLEILSGHEQRMAERIKDLRAQLLDAHAEMIRRDDEIRNTLLIERNALIAERDALYLSLRSAELRLSRFRNSPLGLAFRALRRLTRGGQSPR
jgi:hypothetical protein